MGAGGEGLSFQRDDKGGGKEDDDDDDIDMIDADDIRQLNDLLK